MFVNNIDIKNFKAKLMSRNISRAEAEFFNYWGSNNLTPIFYKKGKNKFKVLDITLDILCSDFDELETMKSNLIKQFENATIKFDDLEYIYRGSISGEPNYKYVMKGNETVDIQMLVIAEKDYVTETMNRITSKTINVNGNLETPSILEITPSIALVDLTITGLGDDPIKIKNITASKKIIINGEDGTVLQDGVNKYGDTEMWSFPSLKPGVNTITVDKSSVDITIKYKPRYI